MFASWDAIPRAALCVWAGIPLPREESFYTAPFFSSSAQRAQVQAANPEPAALPRWRGNIPPSDAGWGCWPRTGAFLGPPRLCRHRETKKPCELSCSQRSQSTRGLPDSCTPGLLAHTALFRTLLKNAESRRGLRMAFLESDGLWEKERRQKEASDLVYSVCLRV